MPADRSDEIPAATADAWPPTVDPVLFARKQQQLGGSCALARFARLIDADVAARGRLDWSAAGSVGRDDLDRLREFLDLRVGFAPVMTCVRCLEPVELPRIDAERRFRLAASERQAEIEDRDTDTVDVIAAVPRLALAELVEDEALLALPMAPAHVRCPGEGATSLDPRGPL
ncbi:MAG: DUF177 domain-containing protein [Lautropia sp.]